MKRSFIGVVALLGGSALVYACGTSTNNNGGNDAGGGMDSALDVPKVGMDAAQDAPEKKDALPNPFADSGSDSGDGGGTCPMPANLGEWTPPAYVHAKQSVGACSASNITNYYNACLSSTGTMADCTAFQTANPTCVACISTPFTATGWGALITNDNVDHINVAGCLELTDPGAAACSTLLEEEIQCEVAACDKVCVVTSGSATSFTQWQACTGTADGSECAMYATPATACSMAIDASAASVCTSATTFEAYFMAVAPIFCGGGDGGTTDAGTKDAGPG